MKIRFWLLLSLLACLITWLYAVRMLWPWVQHRGETVDGIKTQLWDLYPRWVGARELLLHGRNPYGPEVSHEIQMAFYGHIVDQDYREPGPKIDEQRFAYPVYVVFLMAPVMYLDFSEVYRWAPFALAFFAALSVPLSLRLLQWRPPWQHVATITLFTVASPQIVQGLEHQQLSVVVGFLLIAGAWCVGRSHLLGGGALLACSTLKPQMAFFPLCFFLVWVAGDLSKRWRLLAGFLVTLTVLITAGELMLPGWVGYFIEGANAYRQYFPTTSVLRMALGDTAGEIVGGVIVVILFLLVWRNRKDGAGSSQFILTFAAFLAGAILAFPLFTPFNQVMLILPTMLLLRDWKTLPEFSRAIFALSVSWPWITSAVLLLFPLRPDSPSQLPLLPSVLAPFFPLILPLLFMSRRGNAATSQLESTSSGTP
ncbi:MAG: glycosyltransferase family 87 protein [Candidatus Sulfotelmatobacter sp.]